MNQLKLDLASEVACYITITNIFQEKPSAKIVINRQKTKVLVGQTAHKKKKHTHPPKKPNKQNQKKKTFAFDGT